MSCDEKLNKEIRASLRMGEARFECLSINEINEWLWHQYNSHLRSLNGKALDQFQEYLRTRHFTPDHLRYIHKNLSAEAWAKTGLELPLEYGTKIPEEKVEAFKTATSKPLGERLEHKTPQLSAASQGELKAMTNRLEQDRSCGGACDDLCLKILETHARCLHDNRLERAAIFREVLAAQQPTPPKQFKYETPQLEPQYQEALRKLVDVLEEDLKDADLKNVDCAKIIGATTTDCGEMCGNIFLQGYRKRCVFSSIGPSVEHALQAFKATLRAQKSIFLIPQLPDDVQEGWRWWENNDGCPSTRSGRDAKRDCDKYCRPIFPECTTEKGNGQISSNCPCVRYGGELVEPHIEKVLAAQQPEHWVKGSTEEHDVEPWTAWVVIEGSTYGIKAGDGKNSWDWKSTVSHLPPHNADPLEQKKHEVLKRWRQSTGNCPCMFGRWTCSNCKDIFPTTIPEGKSNSDEDCPCGQFGNPPVLAKGPKQKEFEPYAAVRLEDHGCGRPKRGEMVKMVSARYSKQDKDSGGTSHFKKNLIPITNPDEALRILLELSGQETKVERIKEELTERLRVGWREGETAVEKAGITWAEGELQRILNVIAELEAEAKQE